jgi:hypothetical protein
LIFECAATQLLEIMGSTSDSRCILPVPNDLEIDLMLVEEGRSLIVVNSRKVLIE